MELFSLILGVAAIAYGIWALVSPFVVLGLVSRVNELETQIRKLNRPQRSSAPATGLAPAEKPGEDRRDIPASAEAPRERKPRSTVTSLDFSRVEPSVPPVINPPEPADVLPKSEVIPKPAKQPEAPSPSPPPSSRDIEDYLAGRRKANAVEEQQPAVDAPEPSAKPAHNKAAEKDEPTTLEEILAGKWLTWVGALAVIIGAGFGFKYAIENNWIGPRERVVIGILTGLTCFAGGAYAIKRSYVFLAQGLTGAALGILYLSLYAAFGWYGIVSYEAAFVGMILTTTLGLSFAGYFNVQPTAVLGMLGGFLTPAMLWPSQDPMWTLFPYLLMLDLGVLLIAGVRRWAGLEILAFGGTLWIWFAWHHQFYLPQNMGSTTGFLTAFLVLFALLSVWHNVIRKRTANAGDFFLIFATPTAYFAALYGLTYAALPDWQGGFALTMTLFYAILATLAALWHAEGRSVIAALAGLAATFLILAAPLQFTGHFVTICWIAEAVLLVELGLYFREKTLAWTGLSLLAKVQGILLIYFLGTLADPLHFQTAFVRIQLHLIGRPETPIDTATSWMSLINGRSLSYLADVIGFAILAWEFGRRRKDPELLNLLIPGRSAFQVWLNVTVPLAALVMIVLETFAWGAVWHWELATIVSAWTIWTALFACGVILWSRLIDTRGTEGLGWLLYGLLACFVGFEVIEALVVAQLGTGMAAHRLAAWWLLNPRGVASLVLIGSLAVTAWGYAMFPPLAGGENRADAKISPRRMMEMFGTLAYGLSLGIVLLETRVWGAAHAWATSTVVAGCALWTSGFFAIALASGYWKRETWVEGLLRGTLVLLQFWFAMSVLWALGLLNRATSGEPLSPYAWLSQDIRGLGLLVTTLVCAAAGWVLGRDPRMMDRESSDARWSLPHWVGIAAYVMGLVTVSLETSLWGVNQGWLTSTILSSVAIWTTLFLVGAVAWRVIWRVTWVDQLVLLTFCVLQALLVGNTLLGLRGVNLSNATLIPQVLDWWLLNPRGIGVILGLLGCALAAWLCRPQGESDDTHHASKSSLSSLLGVAAFVTALVLMLTELVIGGSARGFLLGTLAGGSALWIGLFAVVLVAWSVKHGTHDYDSLIIILYAGLLLVLIGVSLGSIDALFATSPGHLRAFRPPVEMWFWNPRFMGFLGSLVAAGVSSWLYRGVDRKTTQSASVLPALTATPNDISSLFAICVYITGVVMFTMEVFVQGTSREWHTATSLAVTLVWTTYATLTLIAGIYWRSGWVRVFSLSLFVLTVIKVFLLDVWHLDTVIRVFAFISLGVALLLVSFLYRRFRDRIRSWMAPELNLGPAS